MKQWLITVSEFTVVIIDALALVMVLIGTSEGFVKGLSTMLTSP